MRRASRFALWVAVLAAGVSACAGSDNPPDGAVHILATDGTVGPVMDRYIDRGITRAEDSRGALVVIQLDTPGGLNTSMENIIKRILDSSVPVAVYVWPPGGRAASAGTFIAMAAHIAAMAPDTRIGAASAVNADGSDIEGALGRKVENDAVALIRALAEERGRNADWAEAAVRDAISDPANAAVAKGVVDYLANDLDALLREVDNSTVKLRPGVTVELGVVSSAPRVETSLTAWERVLNVLADPTLATILISLGFLGIVFELSNPGIFLPGTAGAISIILGFMGLGALEIETAGLLLIGLALILFALELLLPSGGVLGAGGIVALLLGGFIAFRDTPAEVQPNRIVAGVIVVVIVTAFVSMAVGLARLKKLERPAGVNALVGREGVARTPLTPEGFVFVDGERWKARVDTGAAGTGTRVRVVSVDGFTLRVRREDNQ